MYNNVGVSSTNVITNYTAQNMNAFIIYQKSNNSTVTEAYVYWKNDTSTDWLSGSNTAGEVRFGIATIPPGATLQMRVQENAICKFPFVVVTT